VIAENPEHPGKAGRFHHLSQDWVNAALKAGGRVARSPARDNDPVRITLSSGTTGLPKQIVVSRRWTDVNIQKIQTVSVGTYERVRALILTGMNTVAWQSAFATWMLGGAVLYGGGTNYAAGMALNPNLMSLVPIQLHNLLQNLPPTFEKRSNLRIGLTGAAAPRRLLQAARARLTDNLFFGFGASETSILAFGPTEIADRVPGAVGYVAPWSRIEVVGEDGKALPNGEIGRMRAYVGDLFNGYRNGESDGDGRVEDGWFYSGDLVSVRDDGLLVLEGREDDVINLGGEKISAFSIEEALMTNPDVLDVAAFALAGAGGVETLHAAIVERPGAAAGSIEATVAEKLRHPVTLVVVDAIQRNQMGKIMRRELKANIAARLGLD
jgi:acyl-coenzyme A synthetase/AMP-(fatty) acid ligase